MIVIELKKAFNLDRILKFLSGVEPLWASQLDESFVLAERRCRKKELYRLLCSSGVLTGQLR